MEGFQDTFRHLYMYNKTNNGKGEHTLVAQFGRFSSGNFGNVSDGISVSGYNQTHTCSTGNGPNSDSLIVRL